MVLSAVLQPQFSGRFIYKCSVHRMAPCRWGPCKLSVYIVNWTETSETTTKSELSLLKSSSLVCCISLILHFPTPWLKSVEVGSLERPGLSPMKLNVKQFFLKKFSSEAQSYTFSCPIHPSTIHLYVEGEGRHFCQSPVLWLISFLHHSVNLSPKFCYGLEVPPACLQYRQRGPCYQASRIQKGQRKKAGNCGRTSRSAILDPSSISIPTECEAGIAGCLTPVMTSPRLTIWNGRVQHWWSHWLVIMAHQDEKHVEKTSAQCSWGKRINIALLHVVVLGRMCQFSTTTNIFLKSKR